MSRKSSTQLLHSEHNVWPNIAKPQKLSDNASVPSVVLSTQRLRLLSFSQSVRARSGSGLASTHVEKLQHAVNVLRLHVKLTCVSSPSDFTTKESDGLSLDQSTSQFQEQVRLEVLHTQVNVGFGTKEHQVVNIRMDLKLIRAVHLQVGIRLRAHEAILFHAGRKVLLPKLRRVPKAVKCMLQLPEHISFRVVLQRWYDINVTVYSGVQESRRNITGCNVQTERRRKRQQELQGCQGRCGSEKFIAVVHLLGVAAP